MATKEQTKISKEVLFDLHRRMVRIRLLEEAAGQLASEAVSYTHLTLPTILRV